MKPWFAIALLGASLAGCATAPPDPNAASSSSVPINNAVVMRDANGVPVETAPSRAPRVNLGIGLGSWGGRGFGGLGIGLGF